jgi:hypothetical protein
VLALLTELEALARAVLRVVGVNLDSIITDSDRPRSGPVRHGAVVAFTTTRAIMLCFVTATRAVAPVIAFVVVVPTTAFIPFYETHVISKGFGQEHSLPLFILYSILGQICTIVRTIF